MDKEDSICIKAESKTAQLEEQTEKDGMQIESNSPSSTSLLQSCPDNVYLPLITAGESEEWDLPHLSQPRYRHTYQEQTPVVKRKRNVIDSNKEESDDRPSKTKRRRLQANGQRESKRTHNKPKAFWLNNK